jgi:excinuclease ABC subunit C
MELMANRMDARWTQRFDGFGPDLLLEHRSLEHLRAPLSRLDSVGESPSRIREQLRHCVASSAPRSPGVYGMIDALGRLIYVGKSKLLRNRLLSYFLPGSKDEKAGRIVELARSIVWEVQPSEFAALLREQSLIRTWQPTLNVVGMPNRRQSAFLCLGRGPAEQFYISRQFDPSASACQGPFFGSGQLHRAVEILNRHFLLRDCSQKTTTRLTDQMSLFVIEARAGCLRSELGTCIAPCLPGASRSKYLKQETAAREFLAGEASNVVAGLEAEMERASAGQHFERALRLREDVRIMKWLTGKLRQHRQARESNPRIYWQPFGDSEQVDAPKLTGSGVLYLIRKGGVEYALAEPTDDRQWRQCHKAIVQWYRSESEFRPEYLRGSDSLGLVATWFQRNPSLKKRIIVLNSESSIPKDWRECQQTWFAPLSEAAPKNGAHSSGSKRGKRSA